MSKQRDPKISLFDIADSAKLIIEFTDGMTKDEFDKDAKTLSAVLHQLLIIGEATKRIQDDLKEQYPNIPWKKMAGTRDVLIHNYEEADNNIVWNIIKNEIPSLLIDIESILNSLSS